MSLKRISILSFAGLSLFKSRTSTMAHVDIDSNQYQPSTSSHGSTSTSSSSTSSSTTLPTSKSAPDLCSLSSKDMLEDQDHTRNCIRWCPTSPMQLQEAEEKLLRCVKTPYEGRYVPINSEDRLWTISLNSSQSQKTPIVLIHGFGSGVGLWCRNLDFLSSNRPLHAFDMLGFGRSSRPKLPYDADLAEEEFVSVIESWREKMGIEKMILVGHSFGGYLTYAYSISHPSRVSHVVLADPWGFSKKPDESEPENQLPLLIRAILAVISPFNPLSSIRAAGPLGPSLVKKVRSDMKKRFETVVEDDSVCNYIYHLNAQTPSGEIAFKAMSNSFAWAQNPMIMRATALPQNIPVTMLYGSHSWMDVDIGMEMKYRRQGSEVNVHTIKDAGHHIYADGADEFNDRISQLCEDID